MATQLISLDYAKAQMQRTTADLTVPAFRIYRTNAASATAATVEVTRDESTGYTTTTLTWTISASVSSQAFVSSDYLTLELLANAVNTSVATAGFVMTVDAPGESATADLQIFPSQSCYLAASEQTVSMTENYLITSLIEGVSDVIEKYCNRTFASATYAAWLDGDGDSFLSLPNTPVTSVQRVSPEPHDVMSVSNTTTSHTLATVEVTSTAVVLRRVNSSGTLTANTLTFASNATLSAMATAIVAVGNGWSATVYDTAYSNERSTLLRPAGARDALHSPAYLAVPYWPEQDYEVDTDAGVIELVAGEFSRGRKSVYVEYTAGYSTIPAAIQQICGELVAQAYDILRSSPGNTSVDVGGISSSRAAAGLVSDNAEIRARLAPFMRRDIA